MGRLLKKDDPIFTHAAKASPVDIVPNVEKTHRFLTTRRYPIYYMPITKCGSTYMKNLMYVLDHDAVHPAASSIHDHPGDLSRADKTPAWMIRRSGLAFSILRDPVRRFFSLYFDKIYGEGPQNFPELREEIAEDCGLDLTPGLDVAAHRANCFRLIGWIDDNLAGDTDLEINPHWRPQSVRVGAVAHLKIGFLTTDGLDRQLADYLGDAIPDIEDKMALVSARNETRYPVDPEEVATPELTEEINAVYADDLAHYRRVSRYWRRRLAAPAPSVAPTGDKINVLTTHRFGVNAIAMQKAGCTYVRNLFYLMDHGRPHPQPSEIYKDGCLVFRHKTAEALEGAANVIVLRDPIARFFSLYFDKVWGESQQAFPWIAKKLVADRRFRLSRNLSQAEHHDNCCRFLGYLESRFKEKPPEQLNPHWRPQHIRADEARPFGFVPILLEDFQSQFVQVAGGHIRGLDEALAQPIFRNETEKPIAPADLISPWIEERLHALYAEDIALYARVKAGWAETGAPPEL